ncbi:hypothetical protein BDA96_05G096100 [Sorghum bicolor]|uniref:Uncharacterized protein n=2 Tax=Sorghum bicolor TaxID=4558 RepID=A0A921QWP9_SORBI|nr:uncharacterized protein LOC110435801 [Sorghum bicolor]KAG0529412.1 hypothetical protein BDA96_05G096100 [Sorghum bicolor]KXG28171.1 hypothetical protein SORBI_3005G093200 [Sorghum bicolor]|eukprot:XP_021317524.1 uncharacterized protein LOC110435801 [Sorghum bicolor]
MTSDLIHLRERDRASSEAENLPPPQPADGHHCAAFLHAGRRAPGARTTIHHRVHGPVQFLGCGLILSRQVKSWPRFSKLPSNSMVANVGNKLRKGQAGSSWRCGCWQI